MRREEGGLGRLVRSKMGRPCASLRVACSDPRRAIRYDMVWVWYRWAMRQEMHV